MIIIGDVHGKVSEYKKLVDGYNCRSKQVGDFGFKKEHQWHLENIDYTKHQINFGNHDDYSFINAKHSCRDWSISLDGVMTVRGAFSIDRDYRIENIDWWQMEELTYMGMQEAIDAYCLFKPKIMITHDCPQVAREFLFGIYEKSLTSNGLQRMFETHQPDLWIFGHHHRNRDKKINGTRFICLSELETFLL